MRPLRIILHAARRRGRIARSWKGRAVIVSVESKGSKRMQTSHGATPLRQAMACVFARPLDVDAAFYDREMGRAKLWRFFVLNAFNTFFCTYQLFMNAPFLRQSDYPYRAYTLFTMRMNATSMILSLLLLAAWFFLHRKEVSRRLVNALALIQSLCIMGFISAVTLYAMTFSYDVSYYVIYAFLVAVTMLLNIWEGLATFGAAQLAFALLLARMLGNPDYAYYVNNTVLLTNLLALFAATLLHFGKAGEIAHKWANERTNRELLRISVQDPLTALHNRKAFNQGYVDAYARACEHGEFLCAVIMDLDYFKAYNDTYGHLQGDECLRRVARVIEKAGEKRGALVARYGGEEFSSVLYGVSDEAAMAYCEEIRLGVQALALPHESSSIAPVVTLSLGYCVYRPSTSAGDESLPLDLADRALYIAKESGRNRTHGEQRDFLELAKQMNIMKSSAL